MGLRFVLLREGNKTRIRQGPNSIVVDHDFDDVLSRWFKWQMQGSYIQDAFDIFTPDEREFLLTGFTPEEFDEATKIEDKDATE